ncbi:hypothetical protein RHGRI_006405 [Rhododendron griersonianum]|uniref:S-adenosyl-L-methionine-dependent methyltransferase superfamily protein n=1 Tax=Rhododendron griersonianum TaxID=479676 RepID=A0AAV6KUC4_9ERIC|nr:hypothetical protein RHGRI_006405 [Rhododendron griersonianum]KAG5555747.1 hypothetical protein RHGRI_006405 [Rhododendron griersonianum]KAG5555748.1 hypothetical protein RHGRI_006405 [Rhododendron griersonianum]
MPLVLQNIRKVLKPDGYVLLRDYATGDLAQLGVSHNAVTFVYFIGMSANIMDSDPLSYVLSQHLPELTVGEFRLNLKERLATVDVRSLHSAHPVDGWRVQAQFEGEVGNVVESVDVRSLHSAHPVDSWRVQAQFERFSCKDQKISENFYVRGDGTRAFYFSDEFLMSLFTENGFDIEEHSLCCKQVENRSREIIMNRRWVQAVFRLHDASSSRCTKPGNELVRGRDSMPELNKSPLEEPVYESDIDIADSVAVEMFGISTSSDEIIEVNIRESIFKIKVVPKEFQHTCKSTGLMLWESAQLMASVIAVNPTIVAGKRVLELGCGCGGICSMVAVVSAANLVVATDGDSNVLNLLTQNLTANLSPPDLDRIVTKRLEWGNKDHIEGIKKLNDTGFEIIIGTDVTYIPEAISPLFATAKELISPAGGSSEECEPAVIFCHVLRRVDEPAILFAASQFGFQLVDKWPTGVPTGSSKSVISTWFPENACNFIPTTALNIMYFRRVKTAF